MMLEISAIYMMVCYDGRRTLFFWRHGVPVCILARLILKMCIFEIIACTIDSSIYLDRVKKTINNI